MTSTKVMARAMSIVALQEKIFRHQKYSILHSERRTTKRIMQAAIGSATLNL